jgi:hypothetical protein
VQNILHNGLQKETKEEGKFKYKVTAQYRVTR